MWWPPAASACREGLSRTCRADPFIGNYVLTSLPAHSKSGQSSFLCEIRTFLRGRRRGKGLEQRKGYLTNPSSNQVCCWVPEDNILSRFIGFTWKTLPGRIFPFFSFIALRVINSACTFTAAPAGSEEMYSQQQAISQHEHSETLFITTVPAKKSEAAK